MRGSTRVQSAVSSHAMCACMCTCTGAGARLCFLWLPSSMEMAARSAAGPLQRSRLLPHARSGARSSATALHESAATRASADMLATTPLPGHVFVINLVKASTCAGCWQLRSCSIAFNLPCWPLGQMNGVTLVFAMCCCFRLAVVMSNEAHAWQQPVAGRLAHARMNVTKPTHV